MRTGADALITIRKLQDLDKLPIRQMLVESHMFTEAEVTVALELCEYALKDPAQKDYDLYTGVDEKNTVAGYYCLGPTPMTDGTFDLYWIAVAPNLQNQGVGKQLLRHAEELARDQKGRLLIAETSSQPKYEGTRKFYLNNRYTEVARIKDYYRIGDDLVVYGKYLSQSQGV